MTAPLPSDAPFGIYLHIPFCARICPYCDFNVYARQEHLIPAYVDALIGEMDLTRAALGPVRAQTIFFGGGTPSLLPPEAVGRLIHALRDRFDIVPDAEVSLEANPESASVEVLAAFREVGINRLSLGVQTQQQRGLKVLGRAHRPLVPERGLQAAREAGFENISLDFIFGWPGQTLKDWDADLDTILRWQPEHVSLYSLIVEPDTPYATAVQRGTLTIPDEDTTADMYERAIERLVVHGWHHYEVSNWARERALRSEHNQIYWRNGQYLGLGAGAHAHSGRTRSNNIRLPSEYIDAMRDGRLPVAWQEELDEATEQGETMMLGLRLLMEGVSATAFRTRHGRDLEAAYGPQIDELASLGLVDWDGTRVRLTARGLLVANDVAARFLPEAAVPH